MGVPVIEINDLSKRFVIRKEKSLKERIVNWNRSQQHKDDFWALRDINLSIDAGTSVGLVGPNGSGKSTLLKMIGGILQPTSGSVMVRGRLAALLELGTGFHPDLTGRENVYLNASILGLSREQTEAYFDEIVDFSGIGQFIDTQVKFYSSGMYVRLAFSVATYVNPDILLVDEVLAVGDEPFQRKCLDRIRQFQAEGRTIILVTHALDQVTELCDRAIVLQNGQLVADGPPDIALRVLRTEFDQRRVADLARTHEELTSDQRPQVLKVVAYNESGAVLTEMGHHGDIDIEVTISVPTATSGLIVGSGIFNSLGNRIVATDTKILRTPLPTLQGVCKVRFHYADVHLAEGPYAVNGQVASPEDILYELKRDQNPFGVYGDKTTAGYTWAPITLTVDGMTVEQVDAV